MMHWAGNLAIWYNCFLLNCITSGGYHRKFSEIKGIHQEEEKIKKLINPILRSEGYNKELVVCSTNGDLQAMYKTNINKSVLYLNSEFLKLTDEAKGYLIKHQLAHIIHQDDRKREVVLFQSGVPIALFMRHVLDCSVVKVALCTFGAIVCGQVLLNSFVEKRADQFAIKQMSDEELKWAFRTVNAGMSKKLSFFETFLFPNLYSGPKQMIERALKIREIDSKDLEVKVSNDEKKAYLQLYEIDEQINIHNKAQKDNAEEIRKLEQEIESFNYHKLNGVSNGFEIKGIEEIIYDCKKEKEEIEREIEENKKNMNSTLSEINRLKEKLFSSEPAQSIDLKNLEQSNIELDEIINKIKKLEKRKRSFKFALIKELEEKEVPESIERLSKEILKYIFYFEEKKKALNLSDNEVKTFKIYKGLLIEIPRLKEVREWNKKKQYLESLELNEKELEKLNKEISGLNFIGESDKFKSLNDLEKKIDNLEKIYGKYIGMYLIKKDSEKSTEKIIRGLEKKKNDLQLTDGEKDRAYSLKDIIMHREFVQSTKMMG